MSKLNQSLINISKICERIQRASDDCIIYGIGEIHNGKTRRRYLEEELGDFMAIFKLLIVEAGLNEANVMNAAEAKLIRVEKFMRNGKTPQVPHKPPPQVPPKISLKWRESGCFSP